MFVSLTQCAQQTAALSRPFSVSESLDACGREKPVQVVQVTEAFPVDVPLPQPPEFAVDGLSFAILDMRLDRYSVERAVLEVGVRARAAKDSYGANFTSDCLRLTVDGMARAPAKLNELLAAGASREAKFEFLLAEVPKGLALVFRYGPVDPVSVPIELPSR